METKKEIKVFIIDDSALFRQYLTEVIEKHGQQIRVVGSAPNGKVALNKLSIEKYESDLVIVDMVMPEMNGVEVINEIMKNDPLPIIAISAFKSKEEVNKAFNQMGLELFESGAVEFLEKPLSSKKKDKTRFESHLIKTIIAHSNINLISSFTKYRKPLPEEERKSTVQTIELDCTRVAPDNQRLIVIGASTGGPKAISFLLSQLGAKHPPIIIIQHMPEAMMKTWSRNLKNRYKSLNIQLAKTNNGLRPNHIYVVPGGVHCDVVEGNRLKLWAGEKINYVAPSIDVTLKSAARIYGSNILALVLTGMGHDGMDGCRAVKANGGVVFTEDETTSVIHSMPQAIIENNLADKIVPLHKIPAVLRINKWTT